MTTSTRPQHSVSRFFHSAGEMAQQLETVGLNITAFQTGFGNFSGVVSMTSRNGLAVAMIETDVAFRAVGVRRHDTTIMATGCDYTEGLFDGIPLVYPTVSGFNDHSRELCFGADAQNVMVIVLMNRSLLNRVLERYQFDQARLLMDKFAYCQPKPEAHTHCLKVISGWMDAEHSVLNVTQVMAELCNAIESATERGRAPMFSQGEARLIRLLPDLAYRIKLGSANDIDATLVAEDIAVDRTQLNVMSKELFGLNPDMLLRRMRVEVAMALLQNPSLRDRLGIRAEVKAIASFLGIDGRTLNRWFRAQFEFTPQAALQLLPASNVIRSTTGYRLVSR